MAHHLSPEVGADELRVAREVFPQFDTQPRDGVLSLDEFAAAFPVSAASGSNDLKQAHLSFGGPGAMWIMWVTDANASAPFVRWGLSSSALSNTSNGTSHTYNVGLLGWHKWIHQARMAPLAPDTVYYYQYGHVGSTVGPVYSFKMPSPSVARLAFHGDQGTVIPKGNAVARQLAKDCAGYGCDAVHVVGDLAYAWKAFPPGPEEEWIWDVYQSEQQVYATHVPHMTTVGNHEQFQNASSYQARYRMPGAESGGDGALYYSYSVGPVHVVAFSMDGPVAHDPASREYAWLRADLAAVNRAVTPWVIFTTHRPVYCSATQEFGEHAGEQALLEPLLLGCGVDLGIVGHMHIYERTFPVAHGAVVPGTNATNVYRRPGAPVYAVQGTGGCFAGAGGWVSPTPAWSAVRAQDYGYAMVVANATHLNWQYRLERDGSVRDSFWIVK